LKTLRSLERDETAITGVARLAISQRRKEKPSMIGISRSSVITSGRCFMTCLMPSSPLTAVATTLIPSCDSSIRDSVTRLYAESSITSARIIGARAILVEDRRAPALHLEMNPYCTFSAKSSTTNEVCSVVSSTPTR
jgi:hypothetical protein